MFRARLTRALDLCGTISDYFTYRKDSGSGPHRVLGAEYREGADPGRSAAFFRKNVPMATISGKHLPVRSGNCQLRSKPEPQVPVANKPGIGHFPKEITMRVMALVLVSIMMVFLADCQA